MSTFPVENSIAQQGLPHLTLQPEVFKQKPVLQWSIWIHGEARFSPEDWGSSSEDELVSGQLLFFHLESHISSLARFQKLRHVMTKARGGHLHHTSCLGHLVIGNLDSVLPGSTLSTGRNICILTAGGLQKTVSWPSAGLQVKIHGLTSAGSQMRPMLLCRLALSVRPLLACRLDLC